MSTEKLQTLISAIQGNPQLAEKLSTSKSTDEMLDYLRTAGINVTPDDLKAAIQQNIPALSDEELENVSSGTIISPVVAITTSVAIK
jgi:predicted ribosomally synthesized peptide with nif11-like leader